ncbi:hypothetical protein NliqN6_5476 [Naganishia liquefaciens]|uniref:Uncharacterized protein n=1 Tax=Naganishia liquefaciens TaxID=104408 RepID=A0A8H3TZK7_9TREE|nr:hypothetical protein NliqN6_5476 [Naganishia liquefaciens]
MPSRKQFAAITQAVTLARKFEKQLESMLQSNIETDASATKGADDWPASSTPALDKDDTIRFEQMLAGLKSVRGDEMFNPHKRTALFNLLNVPLDSRMRNNFADLERILRDLLTQLNASFENEKDILLDSNEFPVKAGSVSFEDTVTVFFYPAESIIEEPSTSVQQQNKTPAESQLSSHEKAEAARRLNQGESFRLIFELKAPSTSDHTANGPASFSTPTLSDWLSKVDTANDKVSVGPAPSETVSAFKRFETTSVRGHLSRYGRIWYQFDR